jgi:hypothetical protein
MEKNESSLREKRVKNRPYWPSVRRGADTQYLFIAEFQKSSKSSTINFDTTFMGRNEIAISNSMRTHMPDRI